ncbi:MAG TPA: ferritin-like domain-containing protein [Stellaceae bacterium]|nr:ferritin-like domain-containing protein [Stellaceae bacterium]
MTERIEATLSRRGVLGAGKRLTLSAFAVALLSGRPSLAAEPAGTGDDVELLDTALVLEHQAIAAYQIGIESGLLQKPVLDLAMQFQGDHKKHAELVAGTIVKLGGKPVRMRKITEYGVPVDKIKTQTDVIKFAADLEHGAALAYVSTIPVFTSREIAHAAATILGTETIHWAVLRQALGLPADAAPFIV